MLHRLLLGLCLRMELLWARSRRLLTCCCSLLLTKLGHLLLVKRCLGRSKLSCHYLLGCLRLLRRIGSLLLGLLHHVEGSCLPHSRGLGHLSLRCSLEVGPGLGSKVLLRLLSQLLLLWGTRLLDKLGLWVHRLRSLLGHGCLLLLELLLLLLGCRCNCVYLLLLLGSGSRVHAYNSLLVRGCLLKANPLSILLNARCSNDLPGPIILHGGLLCLLLSRLLL